MKELMLSLLTWVGANTSYQVDVALPNLAMVTEHNMCAVYGVNNKSQCDALKLRGFYNKASTIYMRMDFDLHDPHHQSQLLHELIHYIQWANGRDESECLGHLELEAYDLQDRWREERDLAPVLADFNRLMLEVSCSA